ncbi:MAG: ABC transporter substrate-binding protein [Acidimicrobiia bacterium]|nr:MAG: ABC transporter substrate-binding protein [Acidimicrobiia bacterium]
MRLRTIPVLLFLLLLAACGDATQVVDTTTTVVTTSTTTSTPTTIVETSTTTTAPESGYPVTVEVANGTITLEAPPTRIVSLSPTATEMLFAVGAGDQVIAADEFSTYPEEAPDTDLSGFTPNVEAIVSYQPDLVIVSNDIEDVVGSLTRLGVPVALLPAAETLDDVYSQIETIGVMTGHREGALEVIAEIQTRIEQAVNEAPAVEFDYYHELGPELYTVTSQTFVGRIYGLFGLENIADPADVDGFGYPQLSAEYIIDADPDLIFLADTQCCGVTPEQVAARPGWDRITAVAEGWIFSIPDDVASRWGPRIAEFAEAVAEALSETS